MKTKDQVISEIMDKLNAEIIPRDIENRLRNAYNEGFKAGNEYGKESGINIGADIAAMHGSDATSKELEEQFWKGVDVGAEKIWELAKKIWLPDDEGGMASEELRACFGEFSAFNDIMRKYSAREALEKLRMWEQEQGRVHVGDEVSVEGYGDTAVVTFLNDNAYDRTGSVLFQPMGGTVSGVSVSKMHKTGRRFPEIVALLKKMASPEEK